MFLDELSPIVKEALKNPVAFAGGFASGLLRLNLNDDPVKSWLDKQSGASVPDNDRQAPPGPQSIEID